MKAPIPPKSTSVPRKALDRIGRERAPSLSRFITMPWVGRLLWGSYALISVYLIVQGVMMALQGGDDFQWDSAYLLLHHQNPYIVSHDLMLHPSQGPVAANQLPSALMLLWGYALFPYDIARYLWLATNLFCTVGIAYELFRVCVGRKGRWREVLFVTSLLGASFPWQRTLVFGQHALVAVYFFLLSVRLAQQGKTVGAGLALAFSFVKYTVTAPLALYFLYKRWYKPLFSSLLFHAALHLFAAWWVGDSALDLVRQSTELSRGLLDLGYIDPFALYRRAQGVFPLLASVSWWPYLLTGLLIIGLLITVARRGQQDIVVLTTLSLLSLVVMYHRDYDFVLLILPLFALLYRRHAFNQWQVVGIGITTLYVLYAVRVIQAIGLVPRLSALVPTLFFLSFWGYGVVCYATIFYLSYRTSKAQ